MNPDRQSDKTRERQRRTAYTRETAGLLLIGALLLLLTVIRYFHVIHWSGH